MLKAYILSVISLLGLIFMIHLGGNTFETLKIRITTPNTLNVVKRISTAVHI